MDSDECLLLICYRNIFRFSCMYHNPRVSCICRSTVIIDVLNPKVAGIPSQDKSNVNVPSIDVLDLLLKLRPRIQKAIALCLNY